MKKRSHFLVFIIKHEVEVLALFSVISFHAKEKSGQEGDGERKIISVRCLLFELGKWLVLQIYNIVGFLLLRCAVHVMSFKSYYFVVWVDNFTDILHHVSRMSGNKIDSKAFSSMKHPCSFPFLFNCKTTFAQSC